MQVCIDKLIFFRTCIYFLLSLVANCKDIVFSSSYACLYVYFYGGANAFEVRSSGKLRQSSVISQRIQMSRQHVWPRHVAWRTVFRKVVPSLIFSNAIYRFIVCEFSLNQSLSIAI